MVKRGTQLSDETKAKMSNVHKGKTFSEEHRQKISRGLTGIKRSDETRRRVSDNHADMTGENNPRYGTHWSEETRKKIVAANTGKHPSDETRKKMSAARRGKPQSEESKRKRSISLMGHAVSENARKKIALAATGVVPSEETRIKQSLAHKGNKHALGYQHTEDTKLKMSLSHRLEKNAAWKGGVSFDDYCPKFNKKLKEEIRNDFNRRCYICDAKETGENHCIHHVDYNKGQGCGQRWSLIPLCHSCHAKTGHHRYYYFNLLNAYWLKIDCFDMMGGFL